MRKSLKTPLLIVLIIFVLSVSIIVFSHSFLEGYGLHLEYSISRYIGLELWSVIFFAICSLINIFFLLRFYFRFKKTYKISLPWHIAFFIMLIGYLVLSFCPVGFFDEVWGIYGTVSKLHRTFAGVMFVSAVVVMFFTAKKFKNNKKLILAASIFVAFGSLYCIFFKLKITWFMNVFLVPEALFLLSFVLIFLGLPKPIDFLTSVEKKPEDAQPAELLEPVEKNQ